MKTLDEILTIYRLKHLNLINLCDDGEITEEQYSEGLLDIRVEAKQAIIELIEGEIIGENGSLDFIENSLGQKTILFAQEHYYQNQLREQQRQKLSKLKE